MNVNNFLQENLTLFFIRLHFSFTRNLNIITDTFVICQLLFETLFIDIINRTKVYQKQRSVILLIDYFHYLSKPTLLTLPLKKTRVNHFSEVYFIFFFSL